MNDLVITVEGGVIQDISGIPARFRVIVMDYDTDGIEPEALSVDPPRRAAIDSSRPAAAGGDDGPVERSA